MQIILEVVGDSVAREMEEVMDMVVARVSISSKMTTTIF